MNAEVNANAIIDIAEKKVGSVARVGLEQGLFHIANEKTCIPSTPPYLILPITCQPLPRPSTICSGYLTSTLNCLDL